MKYADLFCGMGSFSYSFRRLGWHCVLACDISENACDNYDHNFGYRPLGDITLINENDVPDHDVLCAGFPCQPFSHAGFHQGFADPRGTMFFHVMRIIKAKNPSFVVLENVPGLLHHDRGRTFRTILNCLETAGYVIEFKVLLCSDYGIPQRRKRLFIVARLAHILGPPILELDAYRKHQTLSAYLGKPFEREVAFTIRCGGRSSGIQDRHNWDSYIVDNRPYRLTLQDALALQGFEQYSMLGSDTKKWKLLGNTIPTIFTHMIGERINQASKREYLTLS